jgi:transcriptional regulator with XRE-family HTH domain
MEKTAIKKLKRGLAAIICSRTGFSAAYVSDILSGKVRVDSWTTAKKISLATGVPPILILEGSQSDIVTHIEKSMSVS